MGYGMQWFAFDVQYYMYGITVLHFSLTSFMLFATYLSSSLILPTFCLTALSQKLDPERLPLLPPVLLLQSRIARLLIHPHQPPV